LPAPASTTVPEISGRALAEFKAITTNASVVAAKAETFNHGRFY